MFKKFVAVVFAYGLWINAAVLVPQSIQLYHAKSAQGVSLLTFGFFALMQFFGFLRGLHLDDKPMAIGWLLSCVVTMTIVVQILIY